MTVEQLLLTGLSAVTAALVYVFKLLWERSEQCEADRISLRRQIEEVKTMAGISTGTLAAVKKCPVSTCPFKENQKQKAA